MNVVVCQNCKTDFEKSSANDLRICAACGEKIKADIKMLKDAKQLFGALGFVAIGMFIPFLFLPMINGADSSGYYEIPGSKTKHPIIFSANFLLGVNALNLIASIVFFSLYIFFKNKLLKKEADYYN